MSLKRKEEEQCSQSTKDFSEKLADIYVKNGLGDEPKEEIQPIIKKWLIKGTHSEYVDKLFAIDQESSHGSRRSSRAASSPHVARHFPIWWSGFFVEDPNPDTNPVRDMKEAAKNLKGFSSLDNLMSQALTEQNNFWTNCSKTDNFKWGTTISENYTKIALEKDPKNIGLFLNKEKDDFEHSAFFNVEIGIINKHYTHKQPVNLHIFNLKNNCESVEIYRKKYKNINFICHDCLENNTLLACVSYFNVGNIKSNSGGRKSNK
jgi:hypothetical protein